MPSSAYTDQQFKFITSTVPDKGNRDASTAVNNACTSTWMAGDIGKSCKNTDQLIAYIRFYQSQLRHAAGRVDRVSARTKVQALLHDVSESLLNDTDVRERVRG